MHTWIEHEIIRIHERVSKVAKPKGISTDLLELETATMPFAAKTKKSRDRPEEHINVKMRVVKKEFYLSLESSCGLFPGFLQSPFQSCPVEVEVEKSGVKKVK